ncbi:MAG: hypothetical protein ACRBBN_21665 [Methyloligellaceae bacterium]
MKHARLLFAMTILLCGFMPINAHSIERTLTIKGKKYPVFGVRWYRQKTNEVYRTFPCGGGVGMKVVRTPIRKYRNKVLSCGGRRTRGKLEYVGPIFNTRDGKVYRGKSIIRKSDPSTLIVQGCVLGGLICRRERLRRMR